MDDLDAAKNGLVVTSALPIDDICGTGSLLSGSSLLSLSGGSLDAAASCEFTVTLSIPGGISPVTLINATSQVSGELNGFAVTGPSASDEIRVENLSFRETFNPPGPTPAGETVTLSITIENLDAALPVSGIGFTNDLDNTLSGLVAKGLPRYDVCGTGSILSGTSFLTFSEGSLNAGVSCTFDIQLLIPDTAGTGDYLNTTSELTSNGIVVSPAASATMEVASATSDGNPDSGGGGGSSGICFINALDTQMAMPFGVVAGIAVLMTAIVGICHSPKEK